MISGDRRVDGRVLRLGRQPRQPAHQRQHDRAEHLLGAADPAALTRAMRELAPALVVAPGGGGDVPVVLHAAGGGAVAACARCEPDGAGGATLTLMLDGERRVRAARRGRAPP
jgi:hypothetical protein